jgi:tetratricopeptide (TPR) repeat protein
MEVVQGFIQKYGIKPWQIVAAFVALGATAWIVKGLVSPHPSTQTASINSASSVSPAASSDSGKQAQELLSQADRQREAESYPEAIATYKKAIALNPNDAKAYWGLCFSLNQMGKPTDAIAQCDRALALNPNYPEALWSKGSAFDQQQQYQEAINFYDQAIKLKPDYAEAWNNQGVALLKLKRPKDALKSLDKATTSKPDWPDAWANRGAALWELKRYDDAIASIDKALKLDPNHPNANNLRQQVRRNLGR